jgi:hypothetical protein
MATNDSSHTPAALARASWAGILGVLLAAAVLRLYRLDAQLWLDEISALNSIRRPLADIVSAWPGAASHILYEALAHISRAVLGETPVAIRLPAAICGVAGVWAFHRLAKQMLDRGALFLAALFATSYHHIFFSQNARGYTALILASLLATALLLHGATRGMTRAQGVAYALTAALSAYVHPLGGFVLAGHVAVVVAGAGLARVRRRPAPVALRPFALWTLATGGVILLLYLPFARSMLAFARFNAGSAAEGPRLGLGLAREVFDGLAAAFGGPGGVAAGAVIGTIGLVGLARRAGLGLALLVAPLILQGAVLVAGGVGLHPRYFATALPVVYLVGGYGVLCCVTWAVSHVTRRHAALAEAVVLGAIVLASLAPLRRYYQYPKQDFLGAARIVDARAAPEDARVGIRFAGNVLAGYYGYPYEIVDSLPQLRALEARHPRVWVVTTLEGLVAVEDSALVTHLHEEYRAVDELPGTVGGGVMHIYVRER